MSVCENRSRAVRNLLPGATGAIIKGLAALLVLGFIGFSSYSVQAEITAQVSVKDENTYGRIVFRFFKLPPYRARISDGVFIISFDEPVNLSLDQFLKPLKRYITIGRMDPDGKSIRFALSRKIKLHTIEAGERLFIDLLPEPWVGLPPSLPQKVIDEISAKTRIDEEATRKLRRREAFRKSKKILKVRVGQYPTFSRLVFDWTEKVGVKVSRAGNRLSIQFDKLIRTDIARLKVDPPKFVTGATSKLTDDGLDVDIMLGQDTSIRAFREGFAYVVDISGPLSAEEEKVYSENTSILPITKIDKTSGARSEVVQFDAETPAKITGKKAGRQIRRAKNAGDKKTVLKQPKAGMLSDKKSPGTRVATRDLKKNPGNSASVKKSLMTSPAPEKVSAAQMVVNKTAKTGGKSVAVKVDPSSQVKPSLPVQKMAKPAPVRKQMVKKAEDKSSGKAAFLPPGEITTDVSQNPKKKIAPVKRKSLKVGAKIISDNVQLKFPFSKDVSAAVFQRGDNLWVVFDSSSKLDLSELGDGRKKYGRIAGYSTIATKNSTAVVLQLNQPSLTTAAREGTGWVLTIGDFIITPARPITVKPGDGSDGLAEVTLTLSKPANLHIFEDPEVGDTLAVVTAFGPPQGIIKSQRFVEFSTLPTAQGIAVHPAIDDLKINVNADTVVISRDNGLMLSPSDGRKDIRSRQAAIDISSPGNIDFKRWARGGVPEFNRRRAELEREIASKTEMKYTIAPRMELARLYVGNRLGAEALGTMEILKDIDPKIENDPLFHALRGVANFMMHRLKAARFDLESNGLSQDKDAKLWMGLLDVAENKWAQARLNFSSGERAVRNYPDYMKTLFRIGAARANIEINNIANARYQLAAMPKINIERKFSAEAAFLNGRLQELLTHNDDALDYYNEALSYGDRMVESEASFYKTMLELRIRYIKPEEALKQLESQLIVWRGDETELKVMRELAKLYIARNNFRRGLETMRTAVTYYPDKKTGRLIQDDMVTLFDRLFLGDKINTMSPLDSLSLYYDFRELTPIGRLGDEMIRRLSDSLISVDLLDQAAELLTHQVEKRLKGAAQAQVATKLAMVHLLRRKPKKALTVIRRTRQAVLPKRIVRSRALIEARALAEMGRYEYAINILANLKGRDVDRARAQAMWLGKDWQGAGKAYERLLGDIWKGADKLTDLQRTDVLRSAIAYTLAGDEMGSKSLLRKFSVKMATSPDAQTFKVITSSEDGKNAEFRNITKKIASIDTLRGFLKEFRKAELPPLAAEAPLVPQS